MIGGGRGRPVLGGAEWDVEVAECPVEGKAHDAVLIADDFVAVADGSTPLVPGRTVDPRRYAEAALELLLDDRDQPAADMFRAALERSERGESVELGASCTVALVRTVDSALEACLLGDCLVVATGDAGTQVVQDERLERLDAIVARSIADAAAAGEPNPTELPRVVEQLVEHRRLANRPNTYWLFAGDPAAAEHVMRAPLNPDARAILLATDGFARLVEPLRVVDDHGELIERALERGLTALCEELRRAEAEPDSMARAPRLSVSDDATAVLLRRV